MMDRTGSSACSGSTPSISERSAGPTCRITSALGLRLAICQGFDQYACVRPVRLPGVPSPLRDATPERIDWVVVRENSEGEAGIGGRNLAARGPRHEVATQTALFTAEG